MRTGKMPEHTFKRSVVNAIRYRNDEVSFRPAVGHDGAVFGDMVTAMATTAFYYTGHELYAYDNAINNVIASGGEPFGVAVSIMLPEHSEESLLRSIMDSLAKRAQSDEIDIIAGDTGLVPTVSEPTIVVTAYGKRLFDNRQKEVEPGMDIVMTKWTGLYGGAILAKTKKDELITRYSESYIDIAANYMKYTSLLPELTALKAMVNEGGPNVYASHDVSFGGVFGALWQLLQSCNMGAEIPVKQIPIKQETIEVCEFFGINPYMMNGQGSMLMITDDGNRLTEILSEQGVNAVVLGQTIKGNRRVVTIGEEERFLVAPKGDMLNQVVYGQKVPV